MKAIIKSKKNLFILLISVAIISLPLLYNGIVQGHDLRFHLSRIMALSNNISNGDWMAYIHSGFFNNYGYANGLFYCNLFLYFPSLLKCMGIDLINSYKIFLVLCNLLTVFSMYFCMNKMTKSKKISLIASILYLINPYRICDLYVRAAVGEVLSFIFLPFVVLGMYSIVKDSAKDWWYLCIGFSGLILSHLLSTVIVFIACFIFLLFNIKKVLNKTIIKNIFKAAILCICITAYYVFPMIEQLLSHDFIVDTITTHYDISANTIPLEQIFSGISHFYNNIFIPSGISFIIIYILCLRIGIKDIKYKKLCDTCILIGIIAVLCTTNIIPWNTLPLFSILQFPWRIYIISSICFSIAAAIILEKFSNKYIIIILCIAMLAPTYTIYYQYKNEYIWRSYSDYNTGGNEYLPAGTNYDLLINRGEKITSNRDINIDYKRKDNKLIIDYSNNHYNDTYIELPLLYYEGYYVNNNLTITAGENNVVRIYLDNKNSGHLVVYYSGTNIAIISKYLSLFTVLIIIIYSIFDKKHNRNYHDKKKMIIYMPKLSVGGMEKALINLLNFSTLTDHYQIELFLGYVVQKEYLDMIPKEVKVKLCCKGKWNSFGKITTYFKMQFKFIKNLLNIDKYDIAISYAYQHPILAKLARNSSKNNIIFVHNNLKLKYSSQSKRLRKMQFEKFNKIVCVSNDAKNAFNGLYPNYKGKIAVINNMLDGESIEKKALEEIEFNYKKPVFIAVARCEEKSKKLSRIIKASNELKKQDYIFSAIIVGDGEDFQMYKNLIIELNLQDTVFLLGKKINPYPYIKNSSALVLSSAYEGYGIVIDEARILNIPVISTDVADAEEILNQGYGIICDNSEEGVYTGMKQFLDEGYIVQNQFDYNKFNSDINNKLEEFFEE